MTVKTIEEIQYQGNIFRDEVSFCRPILLLYSGSARCVNQHFPESPFVAKRLATGGIVALSDALGLAGIDFFGDIYAEKKGLQVLMLEKPDQVLDAYERLILREVMNTNLNELQNMMESRF